jgi:hypothetical protein
LSCPSLKFGTHSRIFMALQYRISPCGGSKNVRMQGSFFDMLRINSLPRSEESFGLALSDARRESCPFRHRACADEFRDFEIAGQGKRKSNSSRRRRGRTAESENRTKTSKKDLISDLFFAINSGNRRKSRIPTPAGKIYGSLSASADHVGVFNLPGTGWTGEDHCERPVHSGTPADFQHSCRNPLNRDFSGVPKAPVFKLRCLKAAAWGRASTHFSPHDKHHARSFPGTH